MLKIVLSIMFIGLVALAGCKEVSAPIEPRMDPWPEPRVTLASQDLRQKTAVKPAIMERRNGILYVIVPIRSASNYDLHLDYQVTFFKENGMIDYQSSWEPLPTLVHNIPSEIRFNSTSAEAADWRLTLRYSR
jgi:hypothetical protein